MRKRERISVLRCYSSAQRSGIDIELNVFGRSILVELNNAMTELQENPDVRYDLAAQHSVLRQHVESFILRRAKSQNLEEYEHGIRLTSNTNHRYSFEWVEEAIDWAYAQKGINHLIEVIDANSFGGVILATENVVDEANALFTVYVENECTLQEWMKRRLKGRRLIRSRGKK